MGTNREGRRLSSQYKASAVMLIALLLSSCAKASKNCVEGEITAETRQLLAQYLEANRYVDDAEALFAGYAVESVKVCGSITTIIFLPKSSYYYNGQELSILGYPLEFTIDSSTGRISYQSLE
jgi:hypothetical protein